jgi:hypothetical protein
MLAWQQGKTGVGQGFDTAVMLGQPFCRKHGGGGVEVRHKQVQLKNLDSKQGFTACGMAAEYPTMAERMP